MSFSHHDASFATARHANHHGGTHKHDRDKLIHRYLFVFTPRLINCVLHAYSRSVTITIYASQIRRPSICDQLSNASSLLADATAESREKFTNSFSVSDGSMVFLKPSVCAWWCSNYRNSRITVIRMWDTILYQECKDICPSWSKSFTSFTVYRKCAKLLLHDCMCLHDIRESSLHFSLMTLLQSTPAQQCAHSLCGSVRNVRVMCAIAYHTYPFVITQSALCIVQSNQARLWTINHLSEISVAVNNVPFMYLSIAWEDCAAFKEIICLSPQHVFVHFITILKLVTVISTKLSFDHFTCWNHLINVIREYVSDCHAASS